ncbi:MAG: helix-turn-helix domain-containing protein [Clostridia bacterium]|nr:helix-turn-helix domain-containing protein [Clostridia bacterium]
MEYKETMGKRISDLRKGKGMTQEQLAQLLGVTPQAVSKWENDLSCPDISILPQLAEALGVTTDELLGKAPLQTVAPETEKQSGKAHVSVRLRMNKAEKVIFALLLMGIGVVFLLNAFHVIELGEGVTFGSVLWPFLVACIGVLACRSELNPVSIGLFLFGVYMLLFNLGIIPAQYKLTWAMAWPVALILVGITILLRFILPERKKKEGGFFEVEKSDPVFNCTDDDGFIRIDSAFSSKEKRVSGGVRFTGAKVDSSFGSLVLDLSEAEIVNGASIDADVSFGSLTIRLPANVSARAMCDSSFGGYDCPPGNPDAEIEVLIKGDVSFGKIEVEYV